jgi:type IV secretion system protein VirB9
MFKRIAILIFTCSWSAGGAFADQAPMEKLASAAKLASPATAAPATPAVPIADPRIGHYVYNENKVYRLDLYLKSVTALQFSENEEVQSILIGDSASWEVVKLKSGNVVSIKPTVPAATTNMTIYTDKRVYSFELHSVGEIAAGETTTLFRSVFTYPDEKKPKPETSLASGPIDSNYLLSGHASFRPLWVQDNGRQTTFFLPDGSRRPAIFKVGPDHSEQLINSRSEGTRVVVDGTSNYWVLRIGNESVCAGRSKIVRANRDGSGFTQHMEVAHAEH